MIVFTGVSRKHVFVKEDTYDVIDAILVDRKTAIALFEEHFRSFSDGGLIGEADDVNAGDHHFPNISLFEVGY